MERELERAARFGTPVSLILFDVDRFKAANDTCGHPFGDLVLTSVAARCRSGLRGSDLLGRLGGDEFGILLPMTGLAEAGAIAERLALSLRSEPVRRGNLRFHVTASFGVAELDAAGESLDAALERTDRALYEAKNGGRDRVTPALSPKPRPAVPAPLPQT